MSDKKLKVDHFINAYSWLEKDSSLQQVLHTVNQGLQIDQLLHNLLGEDLAKQCKALYIRQDFLHIAVNNNACAAKIKQLGPSISRLLSSHGYSVQTIKIKVMNQPPADGPNAVAGTSTQLANQELEQAKNNAADAALCGLYVNLKDGPIKKAVAELLQKHNLPLQTPTKQDANQD